MRNLLTYEKYLNEDLKIPSGKWIDYDLSRLDKEGLDLIWSMYTKTYSKEGLDFSADEAGELKTKYKAIYLIDIDNDKIPDAFIIYKETPYGNKIALSGTNDKKEAKSKIVKKIIELVNTKGWFVEASLKIEQIMKSNNVPVIKDESVIRDVVGKDKEVEMGEDGYYYRYLSKVHKKIEKRMYGILK